MGHHEFVRPCTSLLVRETAWQARGISQPMSLAQWHHAVCGHHALFNLRRLVAMSTGLKLQFGPDTFPGCLLSGDSSLLQNEPCFWRQALCDIEQLTSR